MLVAVDQLRSPTVTSTGQLSDAEAGGLRGEPCDILCHCASLGRGDEWLSTLAICRAHNDGQPNWMQPHSLIFSEDELSGLQEKPDRQSRKSPLATKPFGWPRPSFPRCVPARLLIERIGGTLGAIRLQRKVSLREVEERSRIFAQERRDNSYRVSVSWLSRLEKTQRGLTVNKLIALAHIYGFHPEELFRSIYPDSLGRDSSTDETTLLSPEASPSPAPYKWGIVGKHDHTLEPLIPTGSFVQIDTQRREISSRKDWARELQRPIYFLKTADAYFCGWCELDPFGEILTLVPHPLSPASSRRWKYRKEIETIGRVVAVIIRSTPSR
jgi:transcriptional regulator with XRE-family HTH domain